MSGSTTPTAVDQRGPSTSRRPVVVGEAVLVRLDETLWRPMIVTTVAALQDIGPRLTGQILVEAADHTAEAFRGGLLEGRITGRRLDSVVFLAYGEGLAPGDRLGQWRHR